MIDQFDEPISCYNRYENDPTQLVVGNKFFARALGDDVDNEKTRRWPAKRAPVPQRVLFRPDHEGDDEPYTGTGSDDARCHPFAYYDDMNFSDWNHADTMAPMIKVQHPEFETIYGGKSTTMARIGYTCSDCHMGAPK